MLNRRALLKLLAQAPVAALLAPTVRAEPLEILDTSIAGYSYYQERAMITRMRMGDPLQLRRESTNKHDARAIEVYWQGYKIGYVPRANNLLLSRLMDQGKPVEGEIVLLDEKDWRPVGFVVKIEI